jgi:formylglycine-generating enzyme required for sulfatase activity
MRRVVVSCVLARKRDPVTAEELAKLLSQRGGYRAAMTLVREYGIQRESSDGAWLGELLWWSREDRARPAAPPSNLATSLGLEFVSVPDGRWVRGRDDGPTDQRPRREVRVKGFDIGKFEVTAAQYQRFLKLSGYRPRHEPYAWFGDPTRQAHPAAGISWHDAKAFTVWLSLRDEGVYRLPTEAEWEWAARGGKQRGGTDDSPKPAPAASHDRSVHGRPADEVAGTGERSGGRRQRREVRGDRLQDGLR